MKLVIEDKKSGKKRVVNIPIAETFEKAGDLVVDGVKGSVGLFKAIRDEINRDIVAVKQRDPAARNGIEILVLYSGVHAILAYRVAHKLYKSKHYLPARAVSQFARFLTGIEIHPGATIGKGLFIDHGAGVVIGETAEIGDNCTLYQGVTLGGTGKDTGKRHPTLGNNVMVGAGAKVLGPFKIGDNTKIAAGAVVLHEIPDNCTAVGIPAKIVRRGGEKVEDDNCDCAETAAKTAKQIIENELDHLHDPDPVAQQMTDLEAKIRELYEKIGKLEEKKDD